MKTRDSGEGAGVDRGREGAGEDTNPHLQGTRAEPVFNTLPLTLSVSRCIFRGQKQTAAPLQDVPFLFTNGEWPPCWPPSALAPARHSGLNPHGHLIQAGLPQLLPTDHTLCTADLGSVRPPRNALLIGPGA